MFFELLSTHHKVFFCEEEVKDELQKVCNTSNTTFIVKPFAELSILRRFPLEVWKKELEHDPEKYHTAELGVIWASKKEFVKEALAARPDTDWACWVDAGCIRTDTWRAPIQQFLKRDAFKNIQPGVYLQCLEPFEKRAFYSFPDRYIAGAICLFHRDFIWEYSTIYDGVVDWYIANKKGITMDQYIMASMVSNYDLKWLRLVDDNGLTEPCPDRWFFFFSKW